VDSNDPERNETIGDYMNPSEGELSRSPPAQAKTVYTLDRRPTNRLRIRQRAQHKRRRGYLSTSSSAEAAQSAEVETPSEIKLLARGGSFGLFGQIANAVLGFGFLAMVSHTLRQIATGGLFEAMAIFTTASVISTCGADVGLIRMLPKYRRHGPDAVRKALLAAIVPTAIVSCIFSAVLFVKAPQLANILVHHSTLKHQTVEQLRLLLPLIPLQALTSALLAGSRAWGIGPSVSVQFLVVPFLRPLLFGFFIIIGISAVLGAVAWGIPVIIGFVATVAIVFRALRLTRDSLDTESSTSPTYRLTQIGSEFWSFATPRLLDATLFILLSTFDVILVGSLGSPKFAATYAIASRYITISVIGLQAVLVAMPTRISDLMQTGALQEANHLYRVGTWWTMGIAWPPIFALGFLAPFFMSLFGHNYTSGSIALSILAIGALATTSMGPSGSVLLMSGKTGANLAITAIAVGVNIPLNIMLIPKYGATGAAIAWTASIVMMNLIQGLLLGHLFRMHPFGKEFAFVALVSFFCFGVYGLILRVTLGTRPLVFVVYAVGSMAAYAIAMVRGRKLLHLEAFGSPRGRASQNGITK
jgi:O-antigen/teichoic acid export membrane protein